MDIDYNGIPLYDKVNYLNQVVDTDTLIYDEDGVLEYIINSELHSLQTLKDMVSDIDLDYEYFKIDGYGYPVELTDEEIDEIFEDYIYDIIRDTDIREDYPQLFDDVKIDDYY